MTNNIQKVSPFELACPIDARYYGANTNFFHRLKPYVSEEAYIKYQIRVEKAIAKVMAKYQVIPPNVPLEIEKACDQIRVEDVYEEECRTGHIVRALVNCIKRHVSEESRPFIHLFATSNDITDTATALRLKELCRDILLTDLLELERVLINLSRTHATTVQIGRTHGKHAVPTTFGYTIALYVSRLGNRLETIENARKNLRGKFSGAVGAYNALSLANSRDPAFLEIEVLNELGLRPSDTNISSQIVEPEYVTDLAYAVISCFSVLANLADDIRHLHRSEIAEVEEAPELQHEEPVGSSTMPHKVNPKNFEYVKSMWKEFMPRMVTIFMDQISEHQRDLTNSASSRFITELFTGFIYSVYRLTTAVKNLKVYRDRMKTILESSIDGIIAEPLYILLTLKGHPDGYGYARALSAKVRKTNRPFIDLIWEDEEIKPYLQRMSEEHLAILKNPAQYVGAAAQRANATCDEWEMRINSISKTLKT